MAKLSTMHASGQAVLYNFLFNETLASQAVPDYKLWLVAPWITNFRLAMPFFASFQEIIGAEGEELYLFDVLIQIASNGGGLRLLVDANPPYLPPLRRLREHGSDIQVRTLTGLHSKLYAGAHGVIQGSLNMTHGGMNQNIEHYSYYSDRANVLSLRQQCVDIFRQGENLL